LAAGSASEAVSPVPLSISSVAPTSEGSSGPPDRVAEKRAEPLGARVGPQDDLAPEEALIDGDGGTGGDDQRDRDQGSNCRTSEHVPPYPSITTEVS
jgi:hypothetical protein